MRLGFVLGYITQPHPQPAVILLNLSIVRVEVNICFLSFCSALMVSLSSISTVREDLSGMSADFA